MSAVKNDEPSRLVTFVFMTLNIFCVVSIVIFNKVLFQDYGFTFANTLVCWHFFCTAFALWVCCEVFRMFEKKRAPWHEIAKLSLTQVGSVAFVNLSLFYNSVGMYQVLKLLNIPVICVMEYFWIQKTYSVRILLTLAVILLGIGATTLTDVQFSVPGVICGVIATVTTGAYQILANTKQKQYNINAMQLLYYQAPMTTVFLGVGAILFDDREALMRYQFTSPAITLLIATGLIAFGVNLTLFLILGRASPVTYQVVGHFKTCAVFFFGFVVLHQPFDPKNFGGILVTLIGIFGYSHYSMSPSKPKEEPPKPMAVAHDSEENAGDIESQVQARPAGPQERR